MQPPDGEGLRAPSDDNGIAPATESMSQSVPIFLGSCAMCVRRLSGGRCGNRPFVWGAISFCSLTARLTNLGVKKIPDIKLNAFLRHRYC